MKKILFAALSLFSLAQAAPRESQRLPKRSQESRTSVQTVITKLGRVVRRPLSGAEVGLEKDDVRKGRVNFWKMQNRKLLEAAAIKLDTQNDDGCVTVIYDTKVYPNGDSCEKRKDICYYSDND